MVRHDVTLPADCVSTVGEIRHTDDFPRWPQKKKKKIVLHWVTQLVLSFHLYVTLIFLFLQLPPVSST